MTTATLAARVRAASGDSVLAGGTARLVKAIASAPGRPVEARSEDDETVWLAAEIAATRIGRAARGVTGAVSRAWPEASARALVEKTAASVRSLALPDRVRVAGVWAVSAALTDAALTPFDPRPASAARWILWIAVLLLGSVALIWPRATATAWTGWRERRTRNRQNP